MKKSNDARRIHPRRGLTFERSERWQPRRGLVSSEKAKTHSLGVQRIRVPRDRTAAEQPEKSAQVRQAVQDGEDRCGRLCRGKGAGPESRDGGIDDQAGRYVSLRLS